MIITYSYTFDVLEFSKLQKKVPNELQKNTQSRAKKKKNSSIKMWEQKTVAASRYGSRKNIIRLKHQLKKETCHATHLSITKAFIKDCC